MTRALPLAFLRHGARLSREAAFELAAHGDLASLMLAAAARRDLAHGDAISFSPKVFIPLTRCAGTSAIIARSRSRPRAGERAYPFDRRSAGHRARRLRRPAATRRCSRSATSRNCAIARRATNSTALGHATTLSYLAEAARAVLRETGLLPHLNPGVMTLPNLAALRKVSVSQGMMLERHRPSAWSSAADRISARPTRAAHARLATIRLRASGGPIHNRHADRHRRNARGAHRGAVGAARSNDAHGHIQEIIVQNFRPKPGTRMAKVRAPPLEEHLWTIAAARLIFEPEMNIQAPPNLSPAVCGR